MPPRDSAALLLKKMKNEFFRVGVITSAHGIRGEVNVFPTTDDPGKFEDLKEVLLDKNGEKVPCAIEHVKYFKKMVILKLAGIDDRNTADLYRQKELFVSREDAVPLEEGQYYLADLIGLQVISDEGDELGELYDILETGANDVYVVRNGKKKDLLLPATEECILAVDLDAQTMTVHVLDGLLDL